MSDAVVISTDFDTLAEALDRGARLRRAGAAFDVALRFPNDRATIANLAARDVVAAEHDPARRAAALDALGAHDARLGPSMLEDLSTVARAQREAARDLHAIARTFRVTTAAESRRLVLGLDMPLRRSFAMPSDSLVPGPAEPFTGGDRIVLWAPLKRTDEMLLALAGACADGAPVDVVCAGGERFGYDVTLIPVADAAATLARAAVVVTVDSDDAGPPLALAAWQRPLCVPSTSGADFWLRGLATYRPWSRIDLARAVAIARALPPPRNARPAVGSEPAADEVASGVPVRIVVRADDGVPCAVTADALARLRYAPFEVTVVRGDDDAAAAARAGGATYVLRLDDGDAPYPEALGRLVAALERSGADAARGDALVTYVVDAPGVPHVLGYAAVGPHAPDEDARDELPLRTLVRRAHLLGGDAQRALTVRVDGAVGAAHRYLDGRAPFLRSGPARPTRTPAVRLVPPRPLALA